MLRLSNILIAVALLAGVARADWTHPFLESGQIYTNTMMLDLVEARDERWNPWLVMDPPTVTFWAYTGQTTVVDIVTNGVYVITNTLAYPTYTNVTLSGYNAFNPFVEYGYTNLPHVTRAMIADVGGGGSGGIDWYGYRIPAYTDDGTETRSVQWWTAFYVPFWHGGGDGEFTNYFGILDAATNYAPTFPYITDPAEILSYTNIGYYTNEYTDAFGVISATNNYLSQKIGASDWYFTRSPPTTQNWNIADVRFVSDLWATNFPKVAGASVFDGAYIWQETDGYWLRDSVDQYLTTGFTNGAIKWLSVGKLAPDTTIWIGDALGVSNVWIAVDAYTNQGDTASAQAYFTNTSALAFRQHTPLDYNHFDVDVFPTLVFSRGSTQTWEDVHVVITGTVFSVVEGKSVSSTFSGIDPTWAAQPKQQQTNGATETVLLTTNNVQLTKRWKSLSGVTATNTSFENQGHMWSVVYTNEVTLYGESDWILTANDMNERRAFLDSMRWMTLEGEPTNNANYHWFGYDWSSMTRSNSGAMSLQDSMPAAWCHTMEAPAISLQYESGIETNWYGGIYPQVDYDTFDSVYTAWPIQHGMETTFTWTYTNTNTNGLPASTNVAYTMTVGGTDYEYTGTVLRGGSITFSGTSLGGTNNLHAVTNSFADFPVSQSFVFAQVWRDQGDTVLTWDNVATTIAPYIWAGRRGVRLQVVLADTPRQWTNMLMNVESGRDLFGRTGQPTVVQTAEIVGLPSFERLIVDGEVDSSAFAWDAEDVGSVLPDPTADETAKIWQRWGYIENIVTGSGEIQHDGMISTNIPYGSGDTARAWAITEANWLMRFDANTNGFQKIR